MKIYVAGPITGCEDYKETFERAERYLQSQGHKVMNPARLSEGFSWAEYMRICISMLGVCDGIYLLQGWEESKGARLEHDTAALLGKAVMLQGQATKAVGTLQ